MNNEMNTPQPQSTSPFDRWQSAKEWLRQNLKGDIVIWIIVALLSLTSMLIVYSATGTLAYQRGGGYPESFLFKHAFFTGIGLLVMWAVHRINYTYFSRLSRAALLISIPLLILVKVAGVTINGATRWLAIPGTGLTFQPADFARLALIANLAAMLAKRQRVQYDWQIFGKMILWVGIICFFIALTSTSTAVLLGFSCFLMLYIGRVPGKYLAVMVVSIGIAGATGLVVGQRLDTAQGRIERFLKRDEYQAKQGFIAIANGGTLGQGLGKSHQRNYLTQAYSDFIYAIIIEEYGIIGGIIIMILYAILLVRGVQNINETNRAFGGLLSAGLMLSIGLQAFTNMAVAVGIFPVTGQPLPLLSMGGTSVLFTCISLGIVLSVSRGDIEETNL
ncbi:FtsW/RodA/SpoVE family cell cycle protein [Runella aurantiaca]|uniref:Probable peptidoglycan glycosyltransferase FtsW n=1 Tax=Runella aurantiaca TaxID=2282308 RepID=A0A369I2L2_9BACT|nr:FtsW/RodA/SpoVE family cell cycle protein [Runella aurantiaca]RDB03798.1 cell division protein FtsW [Runella aurantiaca]